MLYSKYKIFCEFLEDGTLSAFKGSALRGAFGFALKKAVCTIREKECVQCILRNQCLFAKFYTEQKKEDNSPTIPHPFIIEPPLERQKEYKKGDTFEFSLILLGNTYELLPFMIYAFELMGSQGIGRAKETIVNQKQSDSTSKKQNTKFKIINIHTCHNGQEQAIYNTEKKQLLLNPKAQNLTYTTENNTQETICKLTINLESALRFKADNSLKSSLDFPTLFNLIVRRLNMVFKHFSEENTTDEYNLDYEKLSALAKNIETLQSSIHWVEQNRYSSRQKQTLKIGGLMGQMTFKGNIQPFIPLLELATLLHLGKQTSFGLGKINYYIEDI